MVQDNELISVDLMADAREIWKSSGEDIYQVADLIAKHFKVCQEDYQRCKTPVLGISQEHLGEPVGIGGLLAIRQGVVLLDSRISTFGSQGQLLTGLVVPSSELDRHHSGILYHSCPLGGLNGQGRFRIRTTPSTQKQLFPNIDIIVEVQLDQDNEVTHVFGLTPDVWKTIEPWLKQWLPAQ